MTIVHDLISIYIYIILAVIILSWIPVTRSDGALATTNRVLRRLTEPVLQPLRAILPRPNFGGVGIDLSALVALILLEVINRYI
ncbi:MAG TPA: YggT family protein [Acidimicrobiales bacterium]